MTNQNSESLSATAMKKAQVLKQQRLLIGKKYCWMATYKNILKKLQKTAAD